MDPRISTVGGYVLALAVVLLVTAGAAWMGMRVFDRAAQGPAGLTVVILLSFLTAMSIAAAVLVEGARESFTTLAATGIGALAGAVTGLYGPRNKGE